MSSKKLNAFKDFQFDQVQRSSGKIFTAHYACRNAALNLTPVTGTTNEFIFQIPYLFTYKMHHFLQENMLV